MTDAEKADLHRLMGDKAFLAFLYRLMGKARVLAPLDPKDLSAGEARRALVLEVLSEIEDVLPHKSPDGQPVFGSIQILAAFAQSVPKEKPLGRRRDPYGDLNDGHSDDGRDDG